MSLNIVCNHIENISLNISSVECKFKNQMHNKISFKLKFSDSGLDNFESPYTEPIRPKYINKENITSYSYFDDKNNFFIFDNLYFSLNELRSSNLILILYDTIIVDEVEEKDRDKDKENEKEFLEKSLGGLNLKNKTSTLCITKTLNLKNKYNQIGYAFINFYKILSQNDNTIMKTASKVFQTFSLLYTETLDGKNRPSDSTGKNNMVQNNNMITNGKMEENSSTPRLDSFLSKEIKFQVFDDVSKPFSEKIFFKGAEIGKVI